MVLLSLIGAFILFLFSSYSFAAASATNYNNLSDSSIADTEQHNTQKENKSIEKEHGEADPYKTHKEYISEPWRLSSSYKVLERAFISLTGLNILLFSISSFRKWRYYKNIQGTNIDSIND